MTMIERVARAIIRKQHARYGAEGEELNAAVNRYWPQYVELARAAIEAMREPTDAMVEAQGEVLRGELGGLHDSAYWSDGWDRQIWSTMIDAALNEPTPPL